MKTNKYGLVFFTYLFLLICVFSNISMLTVYQFQNYFNTH